MKSVHAEDLRKRSASDSEEDDESTVKLGHAARSLLDLYEGECLPLAAELKSASKQAAQTVARVRAYRRRTHTHEDVSSEDEDDDEASLKTAATAGRLAALAGALASSERGRIALDRKRVAQELLAVASSDHREASRAAAQALRSLASHSEHARRYLFEALRSAADDALSDPCQLGGRSQGRGAARKGVEFTKGPRRGAGHGAVRGLFAFCLDVVPRAALSDDPQIAASLLRPCLGVLCKVASSPDNDTVIKWLQKESGRLPRESGPWRSLSRFSRPTDVRSAFEKWKGPPAKHWWLQALTGSNEGVPAAGVAAIARGLR